jgi:hypothetical protein
MLQRRSSPSASWGLSHNDAMLLIVYKSFRFSPCLHLILMSVYIYTHVVHIQEISLALIRVEGAPHKPCDPTHGRKAHVHRDPLGIFDMTDVHKRGNQTARNTAPRRTSFDDAVGYPCR